VTTLGRSDTSEGSGATGGFVLVAPAPPGTAAGVTVVGVGKTWGSVRALSGVTVNVGVGEVVGLVGENGAGKSTLINIISGAVRPDGGEIHINGAPAPLGDPRRLAALGVAVVMQEQSLVENLRVYENLFLGAEDLVHDRLGSAVGPSMVSRRRRMRRLAQELLGHVGLEDIPADARVGTLTFPQRQLVEIAKAFVGAELRQQRAVILLDEPTSALSKQETEVLFALIDSWRDRAAFIYVSHVLSDVRRICTRIVVLKDGVVVDDLANEGIDDARLHELMVGRTRNADYYLEADQVAVDPLAAPVVELIGATSHGGFTDVDIQVRPGEIVGLAGVVGSGASDLAGAIAGERPIHDGVMRIAGRAVGRWSIRAAIRAGVLYVPPERATDAIFASASVAHNVSIGVLDQMRSPATRLINLRQERRTVHRLVREMRVKVGSTRSPAVELSGGNQQKLVFARWLDRPCRVLVLDDPTRGIDVGSREELYATIRQIAARGVAIVLRSESLEELIGLSNRIVAVKQGQVTAILDSPPKQKPEEVDVVRHMI
jgi:ribose transport system ATP-binding protein